ncbi:hypothetical protein PMIN06_005271 [Paraphaeosphaeria minitans]
MFEQDKAGVDIPVYADSDLYDDSVGEGCEYDPTEDSKAIEVDSNIDLSTDGEHFARGKEDVAVDCADDRDVASYEDGLDADDSGLLIELSGSSPISCGSDTSEEEAHVPLVHHPDCGCAREHGWDCICDWRYGPRAVAIMLVEKLGRLGFRYAEMQHVRRSRHFRKCGETPSATISPA